MTITSNYAKPADSTKCPRGGKRSSKLLRISFNSCTSATDLSQPGRKLRSKASRLRYAGRTYITEVRHAPDILKPRLTFTASRFIVDNPESTSIQPDALMPLLEQFYRKRAHEKLLVRVRHWQRETGLQATGARIRHFQSRWASCDTNNTLEFHPRIMELPASVQDYVIVHELCHTVEKNHTKAFWAFVSSHMPD
nr:SprT family zinc-dependent metalloprotease [Pseudomonas sp. DP16D-R1]